MLSKTRDIISKAWRDDCLWTAEQTGFEYPVCIVFAGRGE